MKRLYILLLVICVTGIARGQNPQWINYGLGSEIICITEEGNYMWIGRNGGLIKLDKANGLIEQFNQANSGLPNDWVRAISIDSNGNKWIGTSYGLAKFNGTNWIVYNNTNSGLPHSSNCIHSIAIDQSGNKWMGTSKGLVKFDDTSWTVYMAPFGGPFCNYGLTDVKIDQSGIIWVGTICGLAKFDGTNWTIYDNTNSGLSHNTVETIAIDPNGNKWINTRFDLVKFDNTNWTIYNTFNSGLPNDTVNTVTADQSGNKWLGIYNNGLAKFDGINWTVYNTTNSGLPDDIVVTVTIDQNGNKWIGTYYGGVAVFNENGVILSTQERIENSGFQTNIYPNPASKQLTLSFPEFNTKNKAIATLYNLSGQQLLQQNITQSNTEIDVHSLSNGIYFLKLNTNKGIIMKKFVVSR